MYSGKAAMQLMGSWEPSTIQNENPSFVSKLGYFNFPALPGGKGDPKDVIGTVGDNFMSVSSSCKNPDAAFKLIQALTDDASAQARLADKRVMPLKKSECDRPLSQADPGLGAASAQRAAVVRPGTAAQAGRSA